MTSNKRDPFDGLSLDDEERATEEALENGEYESVGNFESSKKLLEEASTRYVELNTTKPITLRIRRTDLIKIKAKAKRNNIPYQTLLGALVHDFAENKKVLSIK